MHDNNENRIQGLRVHPAAELFPDFDNARFEELKEDIKERGLRRAIVKKGDVILDGRHRLRACRELGIEPTFQEFTGNDEVAYIISVNVLRRHLTADQRVAVLAKLRGHALKVEAERRMKAGVTVKSAEGPREAGEQLAEDAKVGRNKGRDALLLAKHSPDVLEAVIAGKANLATAASALRERRSQHNQTKQRNLAAPKPLEEIVQTRFLRFMSYWPISVHRDVRAVLATLL